MLHLLLGLTLAAPASEVLYTDPDATRARARALEAEVAAARGLPFLDAIPVFI